MRPDGTIERHDELYRSAWYSTTDPAVADATCDLPTFYEYIRYALRLYQGFYIPHPRDPMSGWFPLAWYLRSGMEVYNSTSRVTYKIEEVQLDTKNNLPTGYVRMSGGNDVVPLATDRLLFDQEDTVVLMHAFPKTYARTYKFNDDGSGRLSVEYDHPWRDTVTFAVARKEPGTLDRTPFQGTRDVRPHFRETKVYSPNQTYMATYTGQWFDVLLQFDCWTKTGETSERLTNWFEAFMEMYRGVFRYNGVTNMLYWDRTRDELVTRWRDDIVNSTVRYYLRMENVAMILESKIRSIYALFSVSPSGEWPDVSPWSTGWVMPTGFEDGVIPVGIYESKYDSGG